MNKTALLIGVGILALGIAGASFAAQWSPRGTFHDRMAQLAENGTYNDLLQLRNETGMPMMQWITDENSFRQWQEGYSQGYYGRGYGMGMMYRFGANATAGNRGRGCPMWDDGE